MSEGLGNVRTPLVRLVRLMSKWENPTFVLQRYGLFYYFQIFCKYFYLKSRFLLKPLIKT